MISSVTVVPLSRSWWAPGSSTVTGSRPWWSRNSRSPRRTASTPGGQAFEDGPRARFGGDPREEVAQGVGLGEGGDVPGAVPVQDGGQPVELAALVGALHVRPRPLRSPPTTGSPSNPSVATLSPGLQRPPLVQGADAEQLAQPGVHAARADPVVLVGHAGQESGHQGAAAADVGEEVVDRRVRHRVELRDDDQPVAGEVVLGVGEVGGEAGLPQGAVPGVQDVRVVDVHGGAAVLGAGPPGVPVVQDGDVRGRCDCPSPRRRCAPVHRRAA